MLKKSFILEDKMKTFLRPLTIIFKYLAFNMLSELLKNINILFI